MTEGRMIAVKNATTEAMDHLHRSLETCPGPEQEVPDPRGIKVPLTPGPSPHTLLQHKTHLNVSLKLPLFVEIFLQYLNFLDCSIGSIFWTKGMSTL